MDGRLLILLIIAGFCLVEEGKLDCNSIQGFRMTSVTLLVGKTDLFYQILIIMLQLIKTLLHLVDNLVLGIMIHAVQFICCIFLTHGDRLSFQTIIADMCGVIQSDREAVSSFCHAFRCC